MFLHSGASLHGHEFSPINLPTARRYPLVRSAFSTPSPKSSYDSSTTPTIRFARPLPRGPRRTADHVSSQEPCADTMSEDGLSRANSECSGATMGGTKRRRRSTRSSTFYHLAHPAPTLTRQQKLLLIRPKLLLQLQRLSPETRPIPSVDVLPSTVVVPRLIKKCPRIFRGKGELGANDVIIVKSEDYSTPDDDNDEDLGDDESLANREVLAVICQLRGHPGSAEICLHDGSIWQATYLPRTRAFEFVSTNSVTGQKTTARWVQRANPRRASDIPSSTVNGPGTLPDHKFLFSIMDPNSRRHPVLASITQQVLDILDSYSSVSTSAGQFPPTSMRAASFGPQNGLDEGEDSERTAHIVDDSLRILIQVTGVWIALRQGWCPYFKYDDKYDEASISKGTLASSSTVASRTRSSSFTQDGVMGDANTNTPDSNQSSLSTMGRIRWSGSHMFRHSLSISASPTQFDLRASVPKRAVSTGTAFMQRAAARRSTIPHSAIQSDSESESLPALTRLPTMEFNSSSGNHRSTPSPLALFGSSTTTPDTPTKPFQRRVQSVLMTSSAVQTGQQNFQQVQINGEIYDSKINTQNIGQGQGLVQTNQQRKHKGGRWRAFISLFRRDK